MRARRSTFSGLLGLVATLLLPLGAGAAEMSFRAIPLGSAGACGDDCPTAIEAVGQITPDTPGLLLAFLQGAGGGSQPIVILDSPGGSVLASMELGILLRRIGATAVVAHAYAGGAGGSVLTSGQCFSACVYAFIGARRRVVWDSSQVGIHRMSVVEEGLDASGTAPVRRRSLDNDDVRAVLMRYISRMGVSPALIEAAERVPSDDLKILSRGELRRWHLAGSAF